MFIFIYIYMYVCKRHFVWLWNLIRFFLLDELLFRFCAYWYIYIYIYIYIYTRTHTYTEI